MSKSGAERKAAHVARHNDIGDIPPIADKDRRERCRYDLPLFGVTYLSDILDHPPSDEIKTGLINKLEQCILYGGQLAIMYPRGAGKTTWMVAAIAWAILYGHRRFPVVIAAKADLAKAILKTVWAVIERSDNILADFPAVAMPIRALKGVAQRAMSQTYHEEPTRIETASSHFRLPYLADNGEKADVACGAIMAAVGIGASVRGLLDMGTRPDLVLFDDPQTKKDAASTSRIQWIEEFIHSDALGLAAHSSTLAACITVTPQKYGDLAMRITDRQEHPEWSVSTAPLVKWGERAEDLWYGFLDAYREDSMRDDYKHTLSRAYYEEHKAEYADTITLDAQAYDKGTEIDAIHHALNLRAKMGDEAFKAECLLTVSDVESTLPVTFDVVSQSLNGYPRGHLPPGIRRVIAFCDVNIAKGKGLSWVAVGFGDNHTAAVVAYGRYPERRAVSEKATSDMKRKGDIASAILAVVELLSRMRFTTDQGKHIKITALGFDRGYEASTVHRTLAVIRRRVKPPFQVCALRGAGWRQFTESDKTAKIARGDHLYISESPHGEYLYVHSPYWREVALSGFLETPLMPGSVSIYGDNPSQHYEFASEVAAERLLRKYMHPSGKLAWDWATTGENHYCDALTMAFALASWYRFYSALPSVSVRTRADNPLFDPIANPAIKRAEVKEPTQRAIAHNGRRIYTRGRR
jgi:hypothetical protein